MTVTKSIAEKRLEELRSILANNPNHVLVSQAYSEYIRMAADSLERRIKKGSFDEEVSQ